MISIILKQLIIILTSQLLIFVFLWLDVHWNAGIFSYKYEIVSMYISLGKQSSHAQQ